MHSLNYKCILHQQSLDTDTLYLLTQHLKVLQCAQTGFCFWRGFESETTSQMRIDKWHGIFLFNWEGGKKNVGSWIRRLKTETNLQKSEEGVWRQSFVEKYQLSSSLSFPVLSHHSPFGGPAAHPPPPYTHPTWRWWRWHPSHFSPLPSFFHSTHSFSPSYCMSSLLFSRCMKVTRPQGVTVFNLLSSVTHTHTQTVR